MAAKRTITKMLKRPQKNKKLKRGRPKKKKLKRRRLKKRRPKRRRPKKIRPKSRRLQIRRLRRRSIWKTERNLEERKRLSKQMLRQVLRMKMGQVVLLRNWIQTCR